ncbi:hypothetical protein Ddye_027840 [Dipteronia dyeriana]|uniref:Disease resistance protein n=1 Tax=Dipteronia dyeriana TaxID=168575 RepID=A0AAD9TQT4_9ROSI|nr:hypothetical protein Ddye_027840 [Dipteronia dyeriana]
MLTTLSSTGLLPETLQYLDVHDCPKLESITTSFASNSSLGFIQIGNCESLRSIPQGLHNLSNLQKICNGGCPFIESISEGLNNLSHLHQIHIDHCPGLVTFAEEGLPSTIFSLVIKKCEELRALPNCMHKLKSLQELKILGCPRITSFPEEGIATNLTSLSIGDPNIYKSLSEWGLHKLTHLRHLEKSGCPDAMSFPEEQMGMVLPETLTELTIAVFPNLKYLSAKGFCNLTCLEVLSIRDCSSLKSFPEVGLPSSLLQLHIIRCPWLEKQCKRDKGQEWQKIADIPFVMIDGKFIYDPEEEQ